MKAMSCLHGLMITAVLVAAGFAAAQERGGEKAEPETRPVTKTGEAGEWRQDFKVDKANWIDHGTSTYFILEPGYRWRYKHGNTTLTITILDETKVVDGVTTRVLEEREEKDGKVVSHESAWLAGKDGAKFGLFLPGKPKVGDKYYQEIAPKVAMDRIEIVSLDEKVETPAGKYEHCLHFKETTPLEKGASQMYYAPGIGLVQDDEFVLVAVEKPGK